MGRYDLQPMGEGLDSEVRALTIYNGDLIGRCAFTSSGGSSVYNVARWNGAIGSRWRDERPSDRSGIYNGNLVAGGEFIRQETPAVQTSPNGMVVFQPLGAGIGGSVPFVFALTVLQWKPDCRRQIHLCGWLPAKYIANGMDAEWQSLGSGMNNACVRTCVYNGY